MAERTWIDDEADGIIADLADCTPEARQQILRRVIDRFTEHPSPIAIGVVPVPIMAVKGFMLGHLLKRAFDEVPKETEEFIRRVDAGDQDCPSPWRLAQLGVSSGRL